MGYKPPFPRYLARQKNKLTVLPMMPIVFHFVVQIGIAILSVYFNFYVSAAFMRVYLIVFVCLIIVMVVVVLLYRRKLRREIIQKDFAVCIRCGYFVGDRPNNTPCPECGLPINFLYFKERWGELVRPRDN